MTTTSESVAVPDIVGSYAEQIRQHLAADPNAARTVPELCEQLNLSDRIVRQGLDRLLFCKEVTVGLRHVPHRRGSMPREYRVLQKQ